MHVGLVADLGKMFQSLGSPNYNNADVKQNKKSSMSYARSWAYGRNCSISGTRNNVVTNVLRREVMLYKICSKTFVEWEE